jgi:hypothetical protein
MRLDVTNPDAAARRLWLKFEKDLDRLNRYNQALAWRGNIWSTAVHHCASMTTEGVCDRPWGRADLYNYTTANILKLFDAARRLNAADAMARSGIAAIQLNEDKTDFSIVVKEGTVNPDWIESASFDVSMLPGAPMSPGGELGIVPLLVYGVVVVVGMVTGALTAVSVCNVLQKKYDVQLTKLNRAAEKDFCSDPNSQTCKTWLGIRKEERLNEKQSWIDKLLGGGAGKALGAGVGLAVAIGLGLYAYSTYKSKKK